MQPSIANIFKALRLIAAAIMSHALVWGGVANAADRVAWTTGREFQQRLAQPVDILWTGNPLRAAIRGLSEAQQVAILLDRRVDPGQKLDLTIKGKPLEAALQTIADHCGLGVSRLGAVVYLGPPSAAQRLRPAAAAFGSGGPPTADGDATKVLPVESPGLGRPFDPTRPLGPTGPTERRGDWRPGTGAPRSLGGCRSASPFAGGSAEPDRRAVQPDVRGGGRRHAAGAGAAAG